MTDGCPLSDQQISFFHTFGYLRLPGLFTEEIDDLVDAFEAVFADPSNYRVEASDVRVHRYEPRVTIPWFLDKHPTLGALRQDARVVGTATALLGGAVEYAESDGNRFSCDTEWHCDIYGSPLSVPHVKLSFYLDPLTASTGAPRVMPGTHVWNEAYAIGLRDQFNGNVGEMRSIFGVDGAAIPSIPLETQPGDLLVWDYRTIHASYGGSENRRLFTVNFRRPASHRDHDHAG